MPAARFATDGDDLAMFACPNPDCDRFNHFGAGNLAVCERANGIRRLYCSHCGGRFSERKGSLMEYTKLPKETVVRIVKCLGHGCAVAAAADICDVDPRTVERMLERAGRRADDFHHQQLDRLPTPPAVVELDELHGRVSTPKKNSRARGGLLDAVAEWVGAGFMLPSRPRRDS